MRKRGCTAEMLDGVFSGKQIGGIPESFSSVPALRS